ncbi:hypothetical protein LZ30DRAFT_730499 [Colletotrichum cereale]|nr:hypothetical protein LZ30DRAFT_730499 [Colletotrichum cereale]
MLVPLIYLASHLAGSHMLCEGWSQALRLVHAFASHGAAGRTRCLGLAYRTLLASECAKRLKINRNVAHHGKGQVRGGDDRHIRGLGWQKRADKPGCPKRGREMIGREGFQPRPPSIPNGVPRSCIPSCAAALVRLVCARPSWLAVPGVVCVAGVSRAWACLAHLPVPLGTADRGRCDGNLGGWSDG